MITWYPSFLHLNSRKDGLPRRGCHREMTWGSSETKHDLFFVLLALCRFDKRITQFAEEKFRRDGIEVKTGFRVVKVSDNAISMTNKSAGDISEPYGMAVWSTGIGTRPVILDFMKQIGQVSRFLLLTTIDIPINVDQLYVCSLILNLPISIYTQADRRVLATDEWLRVRGCDGVYALGDCATISQRKVMVCAVWISERNLVSPKHSILLYTNNVRLGNLELYFSPNQKKHIWSLWGSKRSIKIRQINHIETIIGMICYESSRFSSAVHLKVSTNILLLRAVSFI